MMNTKRSIALLLAVSATACVEKDDGELTEANVASALEMENGGLDEADEAPTFGDDEAYEAARIEPDGAVDDPMRSDARVGEMDRLAAAERHRLLVAWGRMPLDLTATTGRNWSGSLTTSRGAIVLGRTIGFEEVVDEVLPRTQPNRIDFRSVTRPHADGMMLRLIDPDPSAGPITLTYTSADSTITHQLDLANLATGPVSVDAGDGNRVVAVGLRERDACDHGFIRGRWVALREGLGAYRGVITNAAGEPTGHIRGIWGTRRSGEHVMFGKFISRDGSFRGLLVGGYENGEWKARWVTRAGDHGLAGGIYVDAPDMRGGVLSGRYGETGCAE